MAATYFTLLTKIGQASIANAVALNKPVNLTYMAVGDGNGNPTTPNENQTALVREKYRAQINQLTVDPGNPNYLIAELVIPTTVGGWSIHEVGVFDDQSQLVAVANFPATYKPELVEGSGRDLIVRIVIQVSNTSVVTLKVDPAVILASQAWVAANYVKKVTVAGGNTGQVLAKKSNASEDFHWVDPTAAVQVIVDSKTEEQTLASGQTIINLAKLTTQATAIYVEGVRLYPVTHYTINSDTRLTLKTAYPNGSKILAVQNDPTSTIAMASTTQKGFTQLSSATNSTSEELAATPKAVKAAYELANGKYSAQDASTSQKGIVQLSSAIDSDSEVLAATPKAVKAVSVGRLLNVQKFTASGQYTPTPGTKVLIVEMVGGGGGGGGAAATAASQVAIASGGSAGAYALGKYDVSAITAPATVTVGNGGTGGVAGNNGGGGGSASNFASLMVAPGGPGGAGSSAVANTSPAANSNTGRSNLSTGGNLVNSAGQAGGAGIFCGSAMSGAGGSTTFGAGGNAAQNANGNIGTGYGSGGSGASSLASVAARQGGDGAGGVVIVWEYA